MHQVSNPNRVVRSTTVVEFFGLPGAGKTTVANRLAKTLRKGGYDVQTTTDFIHWLSKQKRSKKLGFVLSNLRDVSRQLFWCIMFAARLRPFHAISLSKIARVPYINVCFDRYLNTLDNTIVVMDQANMQLIWSVGAFSACYDKALLRRACLATVGVHPRHFVCLAPDVAEASTRLRVRTSNYSRFDALRGVQLDRTLNDASKIIMDLRSFIDQEGLDLTDIDATLAPDENADCLAAQVLKVSHQTNKGT